MTSYSPRAAALVAEMEMAAAADPARTVAFQGAPGAYSHQAVREKFPGQPALPCVAFEDAIEAVQTGRAQVAMIPIENSLHGRVADVHFLLPESGLHIVDEHFVRVRHCLLGLATRAELRAVLSHTQALGQCRTHLRAWGLEPVAHFDTAGAAAEVADAGDATRGAIASRLAGELYGLQILAEGVEDADHNTTRFVVLSRDAGSVVPGTRTMTSVMFETRNIPAALYKALGGFATNGVNITKLESYLRDGRFEAAEFYMDVEGAPEEPGLKLALEELAFHSKWLRLIGTYPRSAARD